MEIVNEENIDELIQAQTKLWCHSFSYIKSMCLKCAVELGIPDIINNHGQPISLSDLISSLPIHPTKTRHVLRLMRILVHSGFFSLQKPVDDENSQETYSLTPASRLLIKGSPLDSTSFLSLLVDPNFVQPFGLLSRWFKHDDVNAFVTANGETFWENASHQESKMNNLLNECMISDSSLIGRIITVKCKEVFEGIESLVDVGGGVGIISKAIAESFPHIHCTVLDLEHVIADLKPTNNVNFLVGDMFEAIPPADAYLFKWSMSDSSEKNCVKMLKNCKEGMKKKGKKGKIIIIDTILGIGTSNDESTETQLFFDIMDIAHTEGKVRTEKEWENIFIESGFNSYKIHPILGPRSLIEVYP